MASTTHIILAEESDADAVAASDEPIEEWSGIEADDVTAQTLAALMSMLVGGGDAAALAGEFDVLAVGLDEGVAVVRMPEELVKALAELDPDRQEGVAERWRAAPSFPKDGYDPDDALQLLEDLADLAEQALEVGEEVLVVTRTDD